MAILAPKTRDVVACYLMQSKHEAAYLCPGAVQMYQNLEIKLNAGADPTVIHNLAQQVNLKCIAESKKLKTKLPASYKTPKCTSSIIDNDFQLKDWTLEITGTIISGLVLYWLLDRKRK